MYPAPDARGQFEWPLPVMAKGCAGSRAADHDHRHAAADTKSQSIE